jgi:hypothetical protein
VGLRPLVPGQERELDRADETVHYLPRVRILHKRCGTEVGLVVDQFDELDSTKRPIGVRAVLQVEQQNPAARKMRAGFLVEPAPGARKPAVKAPKGTFAETLVAHAIIEGPTADKLPDRIECWCSRCGRGAYVRKTRLESRLADARTDGVRMNARANDTV